MLTRRRFIKFGVAGTVILTVAGLVRAQRVEQADSTNQPLAVLRGRDRPMVRAIVLAMLPTAGLTRDTVDSVVAGVDRAIVGLPPHLQAEVAQLFALLGSWAGRRWIAGVRSPWVEASQEEIAQFLEAWRFSGWRLLQQGYHALHELVMAAWYAGADSWVAIDYPGPPILR
jgi:hypothetical protein